MSSFIAIRSTKSKVAKLLAGIVESYFMKKYIQR